MAEIDSTDKTTMPEKARPPLRRRILFGLVTMAIGIMGGLVLVEIGLRIAGYSAPEFYRADEVKGYSLIPGMSGWYQKEGQSYVSLNADGFRDVEHTLAKPAGTLRVAVIGDSFVEALQVEQSEMFAGFAKTELDACGGGKQIEFLTFGVSGYGTAQELLMLKHDVLKYSPDLVLLLMTTNNDITDNYRKFKGIAIPYYVFKDGQLILDDSFRNEKGYVFRASFLNRTWIWLTNHLRVIQAGSQIQIGIKHQFQKWKAAPAAPAQAFAAEQAAPVPELGIDYGVYREPKDADWKEAWAVTEGVIDLMKTEVEKSGARFVVVTGSNGAQVLPDVEQRRAFANILGVPDLHYPDRRIAEFCKARSIDVITLAPALGEFAAEKQAVLHGFEGNLGYGHWNQTGHQAAGVTLGRELCRELIP